MTPSNWHTPNVLLYTGNVLFNPWGSDRPVVPYVSGGIGALTTLDGADANTYGLAGKTTYLVGSAGAGVRWFPIRHWGARADYHFIGIKNDRSGVSGPGRRVMRTAHRVYGALVLTF